MRLRYLGKTAESIEGKCEALRLMQKAVENTEGSGVS
jgi:hypothetical protein